MAHREGRKQGSSCKKLYGDLCHSVMEKIDKAEKEDKDRTDDKTLKNNDGEKKPENQGEKDNLSFWEKKSKMAKFDMDKKMLMKKKKPVDWPIERHETTRSCRELVLLMTEEEISSPPGSDSHRRRGLTTDRDKTRVGHQEM